MAIAAVVMMVAMCGGMLWMHGSGRPPMEDGRRAASLAHRHGLASGAVDASTATVKTESAAE